MRRIRVIQKMTKSKKSKSFRSNIAIHPHVIASIIAAIAIVTWAIIFSGWRLITQK